MSFSEIGAYLDSLIQISIGIVLTYLGFFSSKLKNDKLGKIFRVCGPLLMIIACFLMLSKFSTSWERVYTDDGIASAEFYGKPERIEKSNRRVDYTFTDNDEHISLILTSSSVTDPFLSKENLVDSVVDAMSENDFVFSSKNDVICGAAEGYFIKFYHQSNPVAVLTHTTIHNNVIYSVIVSCIRNEEAREEVQKFHSSFQVAKSEADM